MITTTYLLFNISNLWKKTVSQITHTYLSSPVNMKRKGKKLKKQIMTNADETTAQTENEGLPQQEVDAMNEEQPEREPDDMANAHAAPNERNSEGEQGYRWPR